MSVIGEGFHDVAAGMQEILMQPLHHLRIFHYRLRHESARLKVAAPLQLEEIAFAQMTGPPLRRSRRPALTARC